MELDVLTLARVQFAMTIMFHYLFPPLSIGLGTLMVVMEAAYLRTGNRLYEAMTRFWTRIFAVNFAMGVATGVVMEFQFGTNWAAFARYVGDVFGSALAAEGIFAFFLESGFLAVLVFGWDRVSPRMHFFATLMVALGSIFSSVWIVVANSWQHTPAGHHVVSHNGQFRAEIVDFWAMVFNPSSMHRLGHVLLGAFILGGFFVMSITAWYVLRGRHVDQAQRSFKLALVFAAVSSALMGLSGHHQAKMVAFTQPAKLAALEGHYHSGPAAMHLFGWPDDAAQEVKYGVAVPGLLSYLVYEDATRPMLGLDRFAPEDRPRTWLPFQAYHLMAGLGGAFIGLTGLGLFLWWRGTLFRTRWLLWVFVFAAALPHLANQAGWVATETGRQPFVVGGTLGQDTGSGYIPIHGGLRTREGLSKPVTAPQVLTSIVLFGLIYAMLFAVWVYVLHSKISHGMEEPPAMPGTTTGGGLLDAASRRADPAGSSLSTAHDEGPAPPAHREGGA